MIIENNIIKTSWNSGDIPTKNAPSSAGLYKVESDSNNIITIDDTGNASYVFRGLVQNNFVSFANMCWRVVRIDGNGNTKLALYNRNNSCSQTGGSYGFIS